MTASASAANGFYDGPPLKDGFDAVRRHLDRQVEITEFQRTKNGLKYSFAFPTGNPDPNKAFVRTEGGLVVRSDEARQRWDEHYAYEIIGSVAASPQGGGCPHMCAPCVDGTRPPTHLSAEQQAYMYHTVLNNFGLPQSATVRLLKTGSGDDFANWRNSSVVNANMHRVDKRIKEIFSSTAGAIGDREDEYKIVKIMAASANEAKEHGVIVDAQFSTHSMRKRGEFVINPKTTADQQLKAASLYNLLTKRNVAYVNVAVIPELMESDIVLAEGWNNTRLDARLWAQNVPENTVLKLVRLNPVSEVDGKPTPEKFQRACSQGQVDDFAYDVLAEQFNASRSFKIITPLDEGEDLQMACGIVGTQTMRSMGSPLVQIGERTPT